MKNNILDYPLHFEERVAIIGDMCNTRDPKALTAEEHRELLLTIMDICRGYRRAVPREQRDLARIPYKFAWNKKSLYPDDEQGK